MIFVVHKHQAERAGLHYDFRLEEDGVLRSWAVPKGLPDSPNIKRLAIEVEDHPIEYANFEGNITEGYGKGSVKVWDKGTYELLGESPNQLLITLRGKRYKGDYLLIRMSGKQWLLTKRR